MRSLFVKVFIWFWLAMTLSGVALLLVGRLTHPEFRDARHRPWSPRAQALTAYGMGAMAIVEAKGRPALEDYTASMEQANRFRVLLLLQGTIPVLERQASPHVQQLARRALEAGVADAEGAPGTSLLAVSVPQQGGAPAVVVAELRHPPPGLPLPIPPGSPPLFSENTGVLGELGHLLRGFAVPALVSCVVGGMVCLGLAWHLTAPVRRLRAATQRLAQGDLGARVGASATGAGDEVAALGRDFDVMAGRVQELLARQQQLLRDISHELRSPLARLSVALELARQRADRAAGAPLDRIEREAVRLNDLIGQLLTLTQLDSGDVGPRAPVPLTDLVEAIAADATFEAQATKRSVRVTAEEPLTVTGSEELLRRAIENVVRNALRYTPPDSEVEIRVSRQLEWARIEIQDHGPGVPAEVLSRLFLPFYRVADARDRQTGGTGIGLAITERAVRLHGGTVEAANGEGGGLRICMRLPLQSS